MPLSLSNPMAYYIAFLYNIDGFYNYEMVVLRGGKSRYVPTEGPGTKYTAHHYNTQFMTSYLNTVTMVKVIMKKVACQMLILHRFMSTM